MKNVVLKALYHIVIVGANLLALRVSQVVVPTLPASKDPGSYNTWTIQLIEVYAVFNVVAFFICLAIKRVMNSENQHMSLADTRSTRSTSAPYWKQSSLPVLKAQPGFTPSADFEDEIARLFGIVLSITAKVDNPRTGTINIKLYDTDGTLAGVVQASLDDEVAALGPDALRAISVYKAKSGLPGAYFVSTSQFSDEARLRADAFGITLVDGDTVNKWRQKAATRAKAP